MAVKATTCGLEGLEGSVDLNWNADMLTLVTDHKFFHLLANLDNC